MICSVGNNEEEQTTQKPPKFDEVEKDIQLPDYHSYAEPSDGSQNMNIMFPDGNFAEDAQQGPGGLEKEEGIDAGTFSEYAGDYDFSVELPATGPGKDGKVRVRMSSYVRIHVKAIVDFKFLYILSCFDHK